MLRADKHQERQEQARRFRLSRLNWPEHRLKTMIFITAPMYRLMAGLAGQKMERQQEQSVMKSGWKHFRLQWFRKDQLLRDLLPLHTKRKLWQVESAMKLICRDMDGEQKRLMERREELLVNPNVWKLWRFSFCILNTAEMCSIVLMFRILAGRAGTKMERQQVHLGKTFVWKQSRLN